MAPPASAVPSLEHTGSRPATLTYRRQWGEVEQPWWKEWWQKADVLDVLLLAALFNFTYVYFYPYSEGVSQAPLLFFLLKYVLWGAALALIVRQSERYRLSLSGLPATMSLLAVMVLFVHAVHLPQYVDVADIFQLGNLLLFVPLALLIRFDHAKRLFDMLPLLMALQVAISIGAMAMGVELWKDGSLVGLFSNPNSFALALNLAIFWMLSRRRGFFPFEIAKLGLLVVGVILSRSNSQLLIFVIGVTIILCVTGRRRIGLALALATLVPAALVAAWAFELLATKVILDSAIRVSELLYGGGPAIAVGGTDVEALSGSVSTREQIHLFAWNYLKEADLASILFGDFRTTRYYLFDSQYLMLIVNYGLPVTAILLWLLLGAFVLAYSRMRTTGEWFDLLAWMAFALTFLFSRVLYYYPINLLFLAWLVHLTVRLRVVFVPLSPTPPRPFGAFVTS